ncbi:MAG: heavy-metal-associated domain-containing protein [Chloroflexi bacterium]|nr:heavy-metal-associated domain-containing protein [Chloroflexota bacterium]
MSSLPERSVELAAAFNGSGGQEISLSVRGMTCGSCVRHVQSALKELAGVEAAEVNLATGTARVRYNPAQATVQALKEAVKNAGYAADEISPNAEISLPGQETAVGSRTVPRLPIAVGLMAAIALAGIYLGIVAVAQDWNHAIELFTTDWYFVLAITAGFGTQVGLFTYVRTVILAPSQTKSTVAVTGAGTGTSTVSMLACCAHHLTDVLPLVGLSGAAIFLTDYRVPFMVLGIATNVVGIFVMLRLIRRLRTQACQI